jgi:hypothetical protein
MRLFELCHQHISLEIKDEVTHLPLFEGIKEQQVKISYLHLERGSPLSTVARGHSIMQ